MTWSCQNEQINVNPGPEIENVLSKEEWSAIKESEPFIASYNALSGINFIIETTKLTYDELLEYAYNEENRHKFKSKIEAAGLTEYFVSNYTLSFDASLGMLFETNEKLKKSKILKTKVLELLQVYSETIEENMDGIIKSYNEEVAGNDELAARGEPKIFSYIGTIGKNITIRECYRKKGLIIRYHGKYVCVKDLYITLSEVTITGRVRKRQVHVDYYSRYLLARQGGFYNRRTRYRYYRYNKGRKSYIRYNKKRIIIDKLKDKKAKCVYDRLNLSGNRFKNMIKKFDGDFPVSHLRFIMEDLGKARGITRAPVGKKTSPNYVITIALNNNSSKHGVSYRPNLMVAKTIAHEVIHAEMFRKLLSLANKGKLNISNWTKQEQIHFSLAIKNNFPGIYDYYRRHKNWQHQQMATHYRKTIANILQSFDKNQHSRQFYLDIAWEGLRYPNIYTWSKLPQTEKNRINKTIKDYINKNKKETCQ